MKISFKWLQDFIDLKDFEHKPELLADKLTAAGLEVEELTQKAKHFRQVVTGVILEKDQHPNADRLTVCKVMTAPGVVHQIVCGATNHKANDHVVVALPGAVLPQDFAIKNSVIRGVESAGMLCSEKELGLSSESKGIMILPEDAPIGLPFAEYMGFDDVTFELKVTPNRADCLSHFGLARELSALLARPLTKKAPDISSLSASTQTTVALSVKEPELCPRYCGRVVEGIKVGPSPDWLKKRLESVGLNSINNVVDATNYVMFELGQPLHAFDLTELKGAKILVEKSRVGEAFITLDGTELTLTGDELMIKDGERSVAMAGIIGGKNSGVSDSTSRVFIESAYFAPASIRRSLRKHGLHTESGYRFSRGVDPVETFQAMDRATELIVQVAGGQAYGEPHDFYPKPVQREMISISAQTVSDRLGYEASPKNLEEYLRRLACQVQATEQGLLVTPPTFRFDLEHEMDLVEEYARLQGYEAIPERLPASTEAPGFQGVDYLLRGKLRQVLQGMGLSESVSSVFCSADQSAQGLAMQQFLGASATEPIRLVNPLSEDLAYLRSTLCQSLLDIATHNFAKGNASGRLFEFGKVFFKHEDKIQEQWRLSIIAWGTQDNLWNKRSYPLVFEIKAALKQILNQLSIVSYSWEQERDSKLASLHPGQTAQLHIQDVQAGIIGSVHPQLLEDRKLRVPVALAELNLGALAQFQQAARRVRGLSKYPAVQRDLALVMPKDLPVSHVGKEMHKVGAALLSGIDIFDVFEGAGLAENVRSVAFRLSFQKDDGTLQDEEVNQLVKQMLEKLSEKFAISVR